MSIKIDTKFDVYSDTPSGRDPDSHSSTLRRYHKLLWSKSLPNGSAFTLSDEHPKCYLKHESELGDFYFSSDGLGHTYRFVRSMTKVIDSVSIEEMDTFYAICSTVGAYIIFPSQKVDGKITINGARGLNWKIKDRFDLTLECIRCYYQNQYSPLSDTLERYANFFALFESFQGYVEFFLLQDMVARDGKSVEFFLPFQGFDGYPLPSDFDNYQIYKSHLTDFITARNKLVDKCAINM